MWKGTLVMISFAGLGEAFGEGDVSAGGELVGSELGVVITAEVEGLVSGEFVGCSLIACAQADRIRTRPPTRAARTTPLLFSMTKFVAGQIVLTPVVIQSH
jgi:hypothetical protein